MNIRPSHLQIDIIPERTRQVTESSRHSAMMLLREACGTIKTILYAHKNTLVKKRRKSEDEKLAISGNSENRRSHMMTGEGDATHNYILRCSSQRV